MRPDILRLMSSEHLKIYKFLSKEDKEYLKDRINRWAENLWREKQISSIPGSRDIFCEHMLYSRLLYLVQNEIDLIVEEKKKELANIIKQPV